MDARRILTFVFCVIPAMIIVSCVPPAQPESNYVQTLQESPLITGFYVTTNNQPEGTGKVVGSPSYSVKAINVFPNPYPDEYVHLHYSFFVTFSHLPDEATIVIVKGRSPLEASYIQNLPLGVSSIRTPVQVVRTLEKHYDPKYNSQFLRWDLTDENRTYVSPGYYRAYIYGDKVPKNYWLDIAIDSISVIRDRF